MLGDLIQIKRYEKRLTFWQLAQKMGIATVSIRAWEDGTGQPTCKQIPLLMNYLGITDREYLRIAGGDLCPAITI
jgi:transcriptional regulator with XRE-family HTH domain